MDHPRHACQPRVLAVSSPVFERLGLFLIICLLLSWAGCAPTPTRKDVRFTPAIEAQYQLLERGRTAFRQMRYRDAIEQLSRLVGLHPDASLLAEARWWLARAYEQSGNLQASQRVYQLLVREHPDNRHSADAAARLAHLKPRLQRGAALNRSVRGFLVSSDRLPAPRHWEAWCAALTDHGFTTIVLDLGENGGTDSRRMIRDEPSRRDGRIDSTMPFLVKAAHDHGLTVVVALRLRDLQGVSFRTLWEDWRFNPSHRRLEPSGSFDLFHPEYLEYALGLLTELVETGIDGILFRAIPPWRVTEGFSSNARRRFEQDFGLEIVPADLFPAQSVEAGLDAPDYPPLLWRWAGWKARARLDVLARIKAQLQARQPGLQCGLELHLISVSHPARALIDYGEDWVEAKSRTFDFYLATPPRGTGETDPGRVIQAGDDPAFQGPDETAIRTLADHLESPSQLWVTLVKPAGANRLPVAAPPRLETGSDGLEHLGLVYEVP